MKDVFPGLISRFSGGCIIGLAARKGAAVRKNFPAACLAGAFLLVSCGSPQAEPDGLSAQEREFARAYARERGISVKKAEALIIEARPSQADRQRWAAERSEREAAGEALQLAYPE